MSTFPPPNVGAADVELGCLPRKLPILLKPIHPPTRSLQETGPNKLTAATGHPTSPSPGQKIPFKADKAS